MVTLEPDGAAPRSWWLDHSPVARPATTDLVHLGALTADVVVVGLGASGLEAVRMLASRGVDVIGVDAVGIAGGAAGANGGFLLAGLADFHHDAVDRLGRDAAAAWWRRTAAELDRLEDEEPTFRRVGSLRIAATPEEERDCKAQLDAMLADGIAAEAYDGPGGRGLLVHGDGVVHPVARCARLASRALDAGARLVAPATVTSISPGTVRIGTTPVATRAVLVAVDGGLERLRLGSGGHAASPLVRGVRTVRLQMLATAPDTGVSLERPVYRRHGYDYVQQLPTGELLLGGGRDVGGDTEWAGPSGPARPSSVVQGHLDGWLEALGSTAPVVRRWAAHAAFTDDRMPVQRKVAPGVHVVGGYSGHGNVLGGILARDTASEILEDLAGVGAQHSS